MSEGVEATRIAKGFVSQSSFFSVSEKNTKKLSLVFIKWQLIMPCNSFS